MSDLLVIVPAPGFLERFKKPSLPPDFEIASSYLSDWMIDHWGMRRRDATARSTTLCNDLMRHARGEPTLVAFHCEPDELSQWIAFLAALGNHNWPALNRLSLLFERPGLRLATEKAEHPSNSVELALTGLYEELCRHMNASMAQRHIDAFRGRIETHDITCETLECALATIDPS